MYIYSIISIYSIHLSIYITINISIKLSIYLNISIYLSIYLSLGHQLAANGKVVVVTMNYRLGALGFLSTGSYRVGQHINGPPILWKKFGAIKLHYWQGSGTLFRNILNTGRWHHSALGSRRGSYVLFGSYLLIRLNIFLFRSSPIVNWFDIKGKSY
jgi:hypothetical protein